MELANINQDCKKGFKKKQQVTTCKVLLGTMCFSLINPKQLLGNRTLQVLSGRRMNMWKNISITVSLVEGL